MRILRYDGTAAAIEMGRRGDNCGALQRAERHSDPVVFETSAEADAGVEPLRYDVAEAILGADVDLHAGARG